jgi:hypothetical protein
MCFLRIGAKYRFWLRESQVDRPTMVPRGSMRLAKKTEGEADIAGRVVGRGKREASLGSGAGRGERKRRS